MSSLPTRNRNSLAHQEGYHGPESTRGSRTRRSGDHNLLLKRIRQHSRSLDSNFCASSLPHVYDAETPALTRAEGRSDSVVGLFKVLSSRDFTTSEQNRSAGKAISKRYFNLSQASFSTSLFQPNDSSKRFIASSFPSALTCGSSETALTASLRRSSSQSLAFNDTKQPSRFFSDNAEAPVLRIFSPSRLESANMLINKSYFGHSIQYPKDGGHPRISSFVSQLQRDSHLGKFSETRTNSTRGDLIMPTEKLRDAASAAIQNEEALQHFLDQFSDLHGNVVAGEVLPFLISCDKSWCNLHPEDVVELSVAYYPTFKALGGRRFPIDKNGRILEGEEAPADSQLLLNEDSVWVREKLTRPLTDSSPESSKENFQHQGHAFSALLLPAEMLFNGLPRFPRSLLYSTSPQGRIGAYPTGAAAKYWDSWKQTPSFLRQMQTYDTAWSMISLARFSLLMCRWGYRPLDVLLEYIASTKRNSFSVGTSTGTTALPSSDEVSGPKDEHPDRTLGVSDNSATSSSTLAKGMLGSELRSEGKEKESTNPDAFSPNSQLPVTPLPRTWGPYAASFDSGEVGKLHGFQTPSHLESSERSKDHIYNCTTDNDNNGISQSRSGDFLHPYLMAHSASDDLSKSTTSCLLHSTFCPQQSLTVGTPASASLPLAPSPPSTFRRTSFTGQPNRWKFSKANQESEHGAGKGIGTGTGMSMGEGKRINPSDLCDRYLRQSSSTNEVRALDNTKVDHVYLVDDCDGKVGFSLTHSLKNFTPQECFEANTVALSSLTKLILGQNAVEPKFSVSPPSEALKEATGQQLRVKLPRADTCDALLRPSTPQVFLKSPTMAGGTPISECLTAPISEDQISEVFAFPERVQANDSRSNSCASGTDPIKVPFHLNPSSCFSIPAHGKGDCTMEPPASLFQAENTKPTHSLPDKDCKNETANKVSVLHTHTDFLSSMDGPERVMNGTLAEETSKKTEAHPENADECHKNENSSTTLSQKMASKSDKAVSTSPLLYKSGRKVSGKPPPLTSPLSAFMFQDDYTDWSITFPNGGRQYNSTLQPHSFNDSSSRVKSTTSGCDTTSETLHPALSNSHSLKGSQPFSKDAASAVATEKVGLDQNASLSEAAIKIQKAWRQYIKSRQVRKSVERESVCELSSPERQSRTCIPLLKENFAPTTPTNTSHFVREQKSWKRSVSPSEIMLDDSTKKEDLSYLAPTPSSGQTQTAIPTTLPLPPPPPPPHPPSSLLSPPSFVTIPSTPEGCQKLKGFAVPNVLMGSNFLCESSSNDNLTEAERRAVPSEAISREMQRMCPPGTPTSLERAALYRTSSSDNPLSFTESVSPLTSGYSKGGNPSLSSSFQQKDAKGSIRRLRFPVTRFLDKASLKPQAKITQNDLQTLLMQPAIPSSDSFPEASLDSYSISPFGNSIQLCDAGNVDLAKRPSPNFSPSVLENGSQLVCDSLSNSSQPLNLNRWMKISLGADATPSDVPVLSGASVDSKSLFTSDGGVIAEPHREISQLSCPGDFLSDEERCQSVNEMTLQSKITSEVPSRANTGSPDFNQPVWFPLANGRFVREFTDETHAAKNEPIEVKEEPEKNVPEDSYSNHYKPEEETTTLEPVDAQSNPLTQYEAFFNPRKSISFSTTISNPFANSMHVANPFGASSYQDLEITMEYPLISLQLEAVSPVADSPSLFDPISSEKDDVQHGADGKTLLETVSEITNDSQHCTNAHYDEIVASLEVAETTPQYLHSIVGPTKVGLSVEESCKIIQRVGKGYTCRRQQHFMLLVSVSWGEINRIRRSVLGYAARKQLGCIYAAEKQANQLLDFWNQRNNYAITIQRMIRGFTARHRFKRLQRKLTVRTELRVAMENADTFSPIE